MEKVLLNGTDVKTTRVGLGTWAMGGRSWQNEPNKHLSIKTIHQALDIGITTIDTAADYGLGKSEEFIGEALAQSSVPREDVQLLAKPGLNWTEKGEIFRDMRPSQVEDEIDTTLNRLQTDYLDLYQIHWPDHVTRIEEVASIMKKLYEKGKIRAIGVSNYTPDEIDELKKFIPIHATQNHYNMFQRQLAPWFEHAKQKNIAGITYGTLAHRMLTGKMDAQSVFAEKDVRSSVPLYQEQNREYYLAAVHELEKFAAERNKTVAQLVMRWTLEQSGVSIALWGARKPEQIQEAQGVDGWTLTEDEMEEIEKILSSTVPSLNDNQLDIYAPPEHSEV